MNQPKFRRDLKVVSRRTKGAPDRYLLVRPEDGQTFELGEEDYFLCRQLNGQRTFEELRMRFGAEFCAELDHRRFEAFLHTLRQGKLLVGDAARATIPYPGSTSPLAPTKQFSFGSPQRFLGRVHQLGGWCLFTRVGALLPIALLGAVVPILYYGQPNLSIQMRMLTDFTNIWIDLSFMSVSVFLVGIPHVLAHGLALVRYGGRVNDWGIRIYLNILPAAYCDISDAAWVRSKADRIRIALAGLYWQLLAAEIGLIGWWLTLGWPPFVCFSFLTVAMVAFFSFMVNLTPLTSGDGYVILAQWLNTHDLRDRVLASMKSWLPGQPPTAPLSFKERVGFVSGLCMALLYVFPLMVVLEIITQFTHQFQGVGAIVLVVVGAFLLQRPLESMVEQTTPVRWYRRLLFGKWRRRLMRIGLWLGLALLMLVPYHYDTGGPIHLISDLKLDIRPQVFGEIEKVMVKENDPVRAGQTVALLSTRVHQKELDVEQANLEAARAKLQLLLSGATPETLQKAQQDVKTYQVQYDFFRRETDRLQPLYKEGVIAEEKFEDTKHQRDLNKERLEQAKANLKRVQVGFRQEDIEAAKAEVRRLETLVKHYQEDVQLTSLTSPINGLITTPYLENRVGYYLKEGDIFAQVEDGKILQAEVETPEGNIGDVKIGSSVRIKVWAYPYTEFVGTVESIAPIAIEKQGQKVVRVLVRIPNLDGKLKSGMTGYAKIDAGWKPVGVVLTRILVRFIMVEVWYWIP
jgi:putative peptide zinc metalloprotease protein